jgi:hypothetical protein
MLIMNGLDNTLSQEIIDMLPEGCRDCSVARFTMQSMVTLEDTLGKSPAEVAEHIRQNCSGWQGEEGPPENIVRAFGQPALALSAMIEENCPYSKVSSNS